MLQSFPAQVNFMDANLFIFFSGPFMRLIFSYKGEFGYKFFILVMKKFWQDLSVTLCVTDRCRLSQNSFDRGHYGIGLKTLVPATLGFHRTLRGAQCAVLSFDLGFLPLSSRQNNVCGSSGLPDLKSV